jgi:hypothetical protein
MTCPGNHENALNFSAWTNRFAALETTAANSNSEIMWMWSVNDGLVHIASINTELYHYCKGSVGLCTAQIDAQLAWLERDLAAVDRSATPWLIVMGHKSKWMDEMGSANFSKIEDILQKYQTDLYLIGHQHDYQRLLPNNAYKVEECYDASKTVYTDCTSMATLVVGSPGCREKISTGTAPDSVLANAVFNYGWGHLQVCNDTHLHWTWDELGQFDEATGKYLPRVGAISDEMWMIKQSRNRAWRESKGGM